MTSRKYKYQVEQNIRFKPLGSPQPRHTSFVNDQVLASFKLTLILQLNTVM